MSRKQNRAQSAHRKRAIRKVAKTNGLQQVSLSDQDPAVLALRVQALEKALNKLSQEYNNAVRSMRHAFNLVDQHQIVQQRISHDLMLGTVRITPVHRDDKEFLSTKPSWFDESQHIWVRTDMSATIDIDWYHFQYVQAVSFNVFTRFLFSLKVSEKKKEPELPAEDVSYFGGNYGEVSQG